MGTIHGQGHFRFRIPNFWCRRAYRLVVLRTLRRSLTLDRRTPRCPRGEYDDTKGVILAQLAKVSGQTKRENDMPYSCLIIEKYHQSRHIYDVSKQSVHSPPSGRPRRVLRYHQSHRLFAPCSHQLQHSLRAETPGETLMSHKSWLGSRRFDTLMRRFDSLIQGLDSLMLELDSLIRELGSLMRRFDSLMLELDSLMRSFDSLMLELDSLMLELDSSV